MKHTLFIAATAAVGLLGALEPASAKTCKCTQHSAEASGEATCSLSESPDYCTISFPTPTSGNDTPATDMFHRNLDELQGSAVELEDFSFATANVGDFGFKPVSGGSLASLALSSIPPDMLPTVQPDFATMFATNSASLEAIVTDFNEDGCVEAEQGVLRVLIIAFRSEKDGRCE